MKKWLIGVIVTTLVFVLSCQIFIPREITVTKSVTAKANLNGVYRFLSIDSNWFKWWPGEVIGEAGDRVASMGSYQFTRSRTGYNFFEISLKKEDTTAIRTDLLLLPLGKDSLQVDWKMTTSAPRNNPFSKLGHYFKARNFRRNLTTILNAMHEHISQVRNIYGVDIRKEKIEIEYLVSERKTFNHIPSNQEIYVLIDEVRNHARQKRATEHSYPMFHIEPLGNGQFELLVGVPVKDPIEAQTPFMTLRLLKGGNVLVTQVKGGQATANSAFAKLKIYADDHKDLNVALPFNSLITDRRANTDTAQWITQVNYPCL